MILVKFSVILVEAANSTEDFVGSPIPIPPSLTGRAKILRSISETSLPIRAGISLSLIAASSGRKIWSTSGIVR